MKNKFARLSKEEKKSAIKEFRESSDNNKAFYKHIKNLKIISIIGIIYAILTLIYDFFIVKTYWNYILDCVLLVFCIFFLVKSKDILSQKVNKYLIDKTKTKKTSK